MPEKVLFTSECVTMGHPDKMADQISDAILDALLAQDPRSRCAAESLVTTGLAFVAGEITSNAQVSFPDIVRQTILDIGYTDANMGIDGKTCAVNIALDKQSPDIAQGVNEGTGLHEAQGAGDQGLMFGYASNETEELMPMPIMLARKLVLQLTKLRQNGTLQYLRPDGKTQVTLEYEDGKPKRVDAIVISTQHSEDVSHETIKKDLIEKCINEVVPAELLDEDTKYHINPTGRFVLGGPHADCGLTGRKIIVDTYGGYSRHGGGAFSGKDPSKVDRSASYMARYIAKNIVAAGLAEKCEVQLSYAIGIAEPTSVLVETFGTGKASNAAIEKAVRQVFNLTPRGIVVSLDLLRPIYLQTAKYGHFGFNNNSDLTWERMDKADDLKSALGNI